MSKGHEDLEWNRRLAQGIGRSRVVIDLFKEEVSYFLLKRVQENLVPKFHNTKTQ
jgi:hypothetical protein